MNATLTSLEAKLTAAIIGLDSNQMQQAPYHKWSIQQIIEHLDLTYLATNAVLASRIGKGRATQAKPTLSQHCGRLLVVTLGRFPGGVSAPAAVTPPPFSTAMLGERFATQISEHLRHMDSVLDNVAKAFGERKRSVSHMSLGPLTPQEWRRFHLVHGLHHLRQIEAIKNSSLETSRPPKDPLRR